MPTEVGNSVYLCVHNSHFLLITNKKYILVWLSLQITASVWVRTKNASARASSAKVRKTSYMKKTNHPYLIDKVKFFGVSPISPQQKEKENPYLICVCYCTAFLLTKRSLRRCRLCYSFEMVQDWFDILTFSPLFAFLTIEVQYSTLQTSYVKNDTKCSTPIYICASDLSFWLILLNVPENRPRL